jgi:hypothetical protein
VDYPKLRAIDAFPVHLGGRDVICLSDPTHLTDDAVFIPHETLFILAHFDGQHSILDIQEAYTRQYDQLLYSEAINALIAEHHDRRRICGFAPMYMLLSTMPAAAGAVLKYDQAIEPATQSMVSYASVAFH